MSETESLAGAEILIPADAFARTSQDEQHPACIEAAFQAQTAGFFTIHASYAAAEASPAALYLDGRLLTRNALKNATGSSAADAARWEQQALVSLSVGSHTLRLERDGGLPTLVALGLRRDTATTDAAQLPPDAFVQDSFPIQDWMIWAIPGIQHYTVHEGGFAIHNGRHAFNRPLYGPPGAILPFSGDRPQWLLAEIDRYKLGILSLAVGDRWLHEAADVESRYDAGQMRHVVRDPAFPTNALTITSLRLPEGAGCILRLEAEQPLSLRWVFGGMRGDFKTDWAGTGGWQGGLHAEDAAGNRVELQEGAAFLTAPDISDRAAAVAATGGAQRVAYRDGAPEALFAAAPEDAPAVGGTLAVGPEPAYLLLAAGEQPPEVAGMLRNAPALFRQAEAAWKARAERLVAQTPVPELDAAARSNNAALDGIWRPPSFLHGAARWADRGWYLGWRGWYGPLCAGDHERVRQAIRFHAVRQINEPATGVQSAGAFVPFIGFDGEALPYSYDMNQVFLDHIRAYYQWTGDLETVGAVWPALKRCLEYERREMDPDGDGLYTNVLNTWISDGHHYNGGGCTQASAYLYRINRFAAGIAERLGEDPEPYREEAAKIRAAVQKSLWQERAGYFAEYRDSDGVLHTAAEAPSEYHPVEFGLAEPLQAVRATEYLTRRLWRFGDQILANDWFPVIVTNGCLAHNETLNSALAYFLAGDNERGWRLLRTAAGAFQHAAVPGSISCYAGREGEQGVYTDFADAVSLFTRCLVEGLFGLEPDLPNGQVSWTPRFPMEWPRASLRTAGYSLTYARSGASERYTLETPTPLTAILRVPLRFDHLKRITLNGKPISYRGEAGLERQLVSIRTQAGTKQVLEITYSHRARFHVADPPQWVAAGEPVEVTATAGTFTRIADPQRALRGARANGNRITARAGEPGEYTFYSWLKLPHAEALHRAPLEIRPAYELREAALRVNGSLPGQAFLDVTLRCNKPERIPPPVEILYAGRTYRARLSASSRQGQPAGADERFRFAIKAPERLSPGSTPVRVTVRANAGPVALTGETRLWSLFEAWPEGEAAFTERCTPLALPYNDRLEDLFTRHYEGEDQPFLNHCTRDGRGPVAWTWYQTDYINLEHVRAVQRDGVFRSDVGVPFRVSTEGENILCVTRWRSHPEEVTIPVGRRAEKIYLLLANLTQNSQTHLAQARVSLEFADGEEERIDLRGPEDVDHLLQHYAARNYPQWIGGKAGGYYGHGTAAGTHADVVCLTPEYREEITCLRIRCLTRETLIGVLGVTVW